MEAQSLAKALFNLKILHDFRTKSFAPDEVEGYNFELFFRFWFDFCYCSTNRGRTRLFIPVRGFHLLFMKNQGPNTK